MFINVLGKHVADSFTKEGMDMPFITPELLFDIFHLAGKQEIKTLLRQGTNNTLVTFNFFRYTS